jgi:lipoprotein-releasing system permease protein
MSVAPVPWSVRVLPFEWMVAIRYLSAKRRQTVISVITVISVVGIAAGVAALIVALAINNGFRVSLESSLFNATAHINILERQPLYGIENWRELMPKLLKLPHVVSGSPSLYGQVAIKGPHLGQGAVLKGVPAGPGAPVPELLKHLTRGSAQLSSGVRPPSIILGSRLAQQTGLDVGNTANLFSYQGTLTPLGPSYSVFRFRVAGIFESGLYDIDSSWAFCSLADAQHVLDLEDTVNAIELRLDDLFAAPEVAEAADRLIGPKLVASTWMEQNRPLLNALRLEKAVSLITVGLIEIVAALNILVVLVMLVMEKNRDVAIFIAMGARPRQIRKIFVIQGLLIGVCGCAIGLTLGYTACALFDHYRWIRLDEEVYAISYVPFRSRWTDGVWVACAALCVSLLATLHPSRSAARILPAEALRYE